MAKNPKQNMNLVKLVDTFHSEDLCRAYLEELRWPKGVRCLRCESEKVARIQDRPQHFCNSCEYHFSVTVGTVMHDSHLPLWKWFLATYAMCESKKGISANQMMRTLNVSYRTAWYLCHRIRAAMRDANPVPLSGIIEVDETYVGGKKRGMGRGYVGNKTMVIGAIERGGNVRLKVEKRNDRRTLHTFIKSVASDDAEAIHTDEWPAYRGIGDADTRHETVNHKAEEWVRADVHTNSVEGVWSLLKRSIVGSYHQLSAKHLDSYAQEMAWRFNNRDNPFIFHDTMAKLLRAETLPYKQLTHASSGD